MFSSLIVDGLEGEEQLPSYSNLMVSGPRAQEYARDGASH